jgi:hypothetical protein
MATATTATTPESAALRARREKRKAASYQLMSHKSGHRVPRSSWPGCAFLRMRTAPGGGSACAALGGRAVRQRSRVAAGREARRGQDGGHQRASSRRRLCTNESMARGGCTLCANLLSLCRIAAKSGSAAVEQWSDASYDRGNPPNRAGASLVLESSRATVRGARRRVSSSAARCCTLGLGAETRATLCSVCGALVTVVNKGGEGGIRFNVLRAPWRPPRPVAAPCMATGPRDADALQARSSLCLSS